MAKGLSRAARAELTGLHQTYIGLLERGQRTPNLDSAVAIAAASNVSLSELIVKSQTASVILKLP